MVSIGMKADSWFGVDIGYVTTGEVEMDKNVLYKVSAEAGDTDVLYVDVVNFVTATGRPTISSIQRQFRIGYNRAARIMESMEQAGVVTPERGIDADKAIQFRKKHNNSDNNGITLNLDAYQVVKDWVSTKTGKITREAIHNKSHIKTYWHTSLIISKLIDDGLIFRLSNQQLHIAKGFKKEEKEEKEVVVKSNCDEWIKVDKNDEFIHLKPKCARGEKNRARIHSNGLIPIARMFKGRKFESYTLHYSKSGKIKIFLYKSLRKGDRRVNKLGVYVLSALSAIYGAEEGKKKVGKDYYAVIKKQSFSIDLNKVLE